MAKYIAGEENMRRKFPWEQDNCFRRTYNCDSCINNGDCIEQGIDGRPRWEENNEQ